MPGLEVTEEMLKRSLIATIAIERFEAQCFQCRRHHYKKEGAPVHVIYDGGRQLVVGCECGEALRYAHQLWERRSFVVELLGQTEAAKSPGVSMVSEACGSECRTLTKVELSST